MRRISLRTIFTAIATTACVLLVIFIITNTGDDPDHIEIEQVKCNCPTLPPNARVEQKESINQPKETAPPPSPTPEKTQPTTPTTTTRPLPPCTEVSNTSAVQRAIVMYYPHHQIEYFLPELRWSVFK